ncbi:MAG: FMN-binding negative transcriptional regulator [Hyphomicrobiales bacterium]|nr:FMN-binding negative transcriptional regulator [Hyphomicrobiales bacterium]
MYQPEHFRLDDRDALHDVMRAHPLGQLISAGASGLQANPVPFVLHADDGNQGLLRTHLARPNAQWRDFVDGCDVLVIFQGPQAYVTPSWYAAKKEHGKVVPTWNYVTVQVRGRATAVQEGRWLVRHVSSMSDQQEEPLEHPWAVRDAPEPFITALTRGIVGVEIAITAISGKFKMSQNRPEADRQGVVKGMAAQGAADAAALVSRLGDPAP